MPPFPHKLTGDDHAIQRASDRPGDTREYQPTKISVSFTTAQLDWLKNELMRTRGQAAACAAAPSATTKEMLHHAAQSHMADALVEKIEGTTGGGS